MKKLLIALTTLAIALSISGCSKANPVLKNNAIHRDDEFGGAYIDISIDSFNKLGFKYGDSLDLKFSMMLPIKILATTVAIMFLLVKNLSSLIQVMIILSSVLTMVMMFTP